MNKPIGLALASAAACLPLQAGAMELTEMEISVPGFADFLAVDGDTVWVTNVGRVEQWSTAGKVADVEMPKPCGTMAMAFDSLWVADCDGGEVYRIDPRAASVAATIPVGLGPSGELNVVSGAGYVWAPNETAGTIAKIDPATNAVVATIAVDPGTSYLAFGFDALWAVSGPGGTLQRIDPATDSVTDTITLGSMPGFLAAGEGAVWVQEQGEGTLARVDPRQRHGHRAGQGRRQPQVGRYRHRRRQGLAAHDRRPDLCRYRSAVARDPCPGREALGQRRHPLHARRNLDQRARPGVAVVVDRGRPGRRGVARSRLQGRTGELILLTHLVISIPCHRRSENDATSPGEDLQHQAACRLDMEIF